MEELTRLRTERGWSQQRLADESGVNKATINQIEKGRRSPNVETLEKLAHALNVGVADFFPKAQAPQPERPREIYDPRASELRRENYLTALFLFTKRQHRHWEKELDERLSAPTDEFFGWARGVFKTVHILSDSLFAGEVFSHSFGTPSESEEDLHKVLLRDVGKMLQITKQLLAEWNRRIETMEDIAAKEQRAEMEHYNEEFQRMVAANFSEVSEYVAGG